MVTTGERVLVIQPSFIGDAILTTGMVETLCDNGYLVDLLVRAGNESLFADHPRLRRLLVWEKRRRKYRHWWALMREIREERYDIVINTHRFVMPGLWTALSGAKRKFGFRQNPLSFAYDHRAVHSLEDGSREVDRNADLIAPLGLRVRLSPKLYPRPEDYAKVANVVGPYVTVAPGSVWYTKRYPPSAWAELIAKVPREIGVHLIGGPDDVETCDAIARDSGRPCVNQAGRLSLLASAALMSQAEMNYANDSSPVHLASSMNAPITVFFLSTTPEMGFGPLSEVSVVRQTPVPLACRPCGPTGRRACPLGHFKCAEIAPVP